MPQNRGEDYHAYVRRIAKDPRLLKLDLSNPVPPAVIEKESKQLMHYHLERRDKR